MTRPARGARYVLRVPGMIPLYILIVRVGRSGDWVDIEARNSSGGVVRRRVEWPPPPELHREEWPDSAVELPPSMG